MDGAKTVLVQQGRRLPTKLVTSHYDVRRITDSRWNLIEEARSLRLRMFDATRCRGDERLISELLVLNTRGRKLKRPVAVQISHHCINRDVGSVGVLWRPSGSEFWQSAECSPVRIAV